MEQWFLHCKKADFAGIAQQFHISPMLARIIRNRNVVTDDAIRKYLNGDLEDLYDPFLMKGMEEGVRLTSDIIRSGGRIRIIGDYDVDGVCSAYILHTFLERTGACVDVRLPNRLSEGYGMNETMVEEAIRDGIALIVTCDNGISALDATAMARAAGIRVIITDHHEPSEILPDADVVIDPKQNDCSYPFRELCGGAVAYKFVQALNTYRDSGEQELLDDLLQFAGMATITDIVPLLDENRILAAEGIKRLRKTGNIGLNALLRERSVEKESINAGTIGYILGPCINSAGRLKNADIAYRLFTETDPQKAEQIAEELSMLNEERRYLTDVQVKIAETRLAEHSDDSSSVRQKIVVMYLPDAHESIAGIIAGRIKDAINRPAIVVTRSENGLKGSGRSTENYNMIEGLRSNSSLFEKYGGHAKACGFTLKTEGSDSEAIERLSRQLNDSCGLEDRDLEKKIWIDLQLPFKYVNETFITELERLEPYGMGNEKPVFAEKNVRVTGYSVVGKNNNVLKLFLEDSAGYVMDGVLFGDEAQVRRYTEQLSGNQMVSLLYYPRLNEYRGIRKPQIVVSSIRITE